MLPFIPEWRGDGSDAAADKGKQGVGISFDTWRMSEQENAQREAHDDDVHAKQNHDGFVRRLLVGQVIWPETCPCKIGKPGDQPGRDSLDRCLRLSPEEKHYEHGKAATA